MPQRLHLHGEPDPYRQKLAPCTRIAQVKGASMAGFPEQAGAAVSSPVLLGRRAGLLSQAERGRRPWESLWAPARCMWHPWRRGHSNQADGKGSRNSYLSTAPGSKGPSRARFRGRLANME